MTRRKRLSEATRLQAIYNWCSIECPKCKKLYHVDSFEFDHMVPVALGGTDCPSNLQPICENCHRKKTYGNQATVAGGDIHKIAKAKRLAKAQSTHVAIVAKTETKKPGAIKSRPFPKTNNWGKL